MSTSRVPDALTTVRDALRSGDGGRAGGTFMRGLTLGALLGAAIAGSAIWQRRSQRHARGAPER